MNHTITVRGVAIGSGRPKICVPLVGKKREDILEQARALNALPHDLVEWRADWFDEVCDHAQVKSVCIALREILGDTPLLFTFRTAAEGGERALSAADYESLNAFVLRERLADLVDVELFTGDELVARLVTLAHENGGYLVVSSHDFQQTPSKDEIICRLRRAQELGGEVLKLAAMPRNPRDVLTLLDATEEMRTHYAEKPLITMSMGALGAVSRLSGEVFGSTVTFGSAGQSSAPGQLPTGQLKGILSLLRLE